MKIRLNFTIALTLLFACNSKHDYPASVTQNFMNSCQSNSGVSQEICSCILDKIQQKYTLEEFVEVEKKIETGQTPSEFDELFDKAIAKCDSKPKEVKNDYPASATQNFMNSCQSNSGVSQEICSCILDKIQQKYTFVEFSNIEKKIEEGQTLSEFEELLDKANIDCVSK